MKILIACAIVASAFLLGCEASSPAPTPVAEPTDPAAMPPSDTVLECDKDGRRDDLGRSIPNC